MEGKVGGRTWNESLLSVGILLSDMDQEEEEEEEEEDEGGE